MNDTDRISATGQEQRINVMFRDLIIRRERQKALRANLYAHRRNAVLLQKAALQQQSLKQQTTTQKDSSQKAELDFMEAHFTHASQHIAISMTAWDSTKTPDIVFIKRDDRRGAYFQTFDKDAKRTARILGMETKKMKVNRRMVECISIPEKRMHEVIDQLARRDLTATVVNNNTLHVSLPRKPAITPSFTMPALVRKPELNIMETLNRNRQDGRNTPIHVENLEVWADSKGNWKVSGMVNGQSVTARSIDQADAVGYKKGEISQEQLTAKYQLQNTPKQQNAVSRKSTLTRRYTLDDS